MKIKVFIPLVLLALLTLAWSKQAGSKNKDMTIIYAYDALCGWCYGFSPIFQAFYEKHQSDHHFEVVSGGMVTGERIGPIGEVASYIKWAYKDVERATGVKFGKDFLEGTLEKGEAVFTSIPAARAMAVFREKRPDAVVPFTGRLQKAIYYDGKVPLDWSHYGPLAADFGLDAEAFVQEIQTEDALAKAQQDFQRNAALGVSGFPTIFVETVEGERIVLCRGAVSAEQLEQRFSQIQKQLQIND